MTTRARSLCIAAGLALAMPLATAADDHAAHGAQPAPAKQEAQSAAQPAAQPAAKPASKPKTSIWDAAKTAKAKPAEKPQPPAPAGHDDDERAPRARPAQSAPAATDDQPISADEALTLLQEGNERWAAGKPINPSIDADRREDLAAHGQHPFVTILTCADSRIPVERVFDRGVGEVFTVRVAGNVAGDSETGTIEYGVEHLKTGLLVVMGHTKCGAVAAACSGAQLHGKVAGLIQHVAPAVDRARRNNPGVSDSDLAPLAEKENVWQSVYELLRSSDEVREMVVQKNLRVVGAIYNIETGKVEFMGEHPWQSELVASIDATNDHADSATTVAAEPEPAADEHH